MVDLYDYVKTSKSVCVLTTTMADVLKSGKRKTCQVVDIFGIYGFKTFKQAMLIIFGMKWKMYVLISNLQNGREN